MTEVCVDGVRFTRAGREVLTIPRLDISAGRTTAVLGPNGAGKTTLLRLIAGLDTPDAGRVLVGGHVANVRRHSVAYVFQEDVFLRGSLLENLVLGQAIRGVPRPAARERAMTALRLLGIDALADSRADRISGGEARRASLARALCLRAPVLLLDEPMAGLDAATYRRLLDDSTGLLRNAGGTTVLVTHDRQEAFGLSDDLVLLLRGRVIAAGPKAEVAANPRRVEVAEVLGYSVIAVQGRHVAIPEDEFRVGPGACTLVATVEAVLDMVREWDILATVGQTPVHLRLARAETPPAAGERIPIHAGVMYEVS